MEAERKEMSGKIQVKLDGMVEKLQGLREFTCEGVLHVISQFVACDDQVSS